MQMTYIVAHGELAVVDGPFRHTPSHVFVTTTQQKTRTDAATHAGMAVETDL
jgi:hypothetical protein